LKDSLITISDFDSSYKEYILKWIDIRNKMSTLYFDSDDFYSLLLEKLFIKNHIRLFNPKHHAKAKFKTWLNMVLNNFYIDLYRKKTHASLDELIEKGEYIKGMEQDSYSSPDTIVTNDIETIVEEILKKIETIPKLKNRVLVKLKLYIPARITFSDLEIDYLIEHSGHSPKKLTELINDSVKDDGFGIRDEDIPRLTDFAKGSVNTTYQRIVRKLNLKSYRL
jgi:DNA-directed RNA polymerase specialized sigma24 family protein